MNKLNSLAIVLAGFVSSVSFASSDSTTLSATDHPVGYACIIIFVIAYLLVMFEERIHLRKSKPVILAAGLIWVLIAWHVRRQGVSDEALHAALMHTLDEYASMFLFLLVAMTYINVMDERNTFLALRAWLLKKGMSYRQLFWTTGLLAFFISPVADNLTTALIMGAVIMAVGAGNQRFIPLAMINVVVAANAGGAFSPFGDITTLMVWQAGQVNFGEFFSLFVPSVVNFVVPGIIMHQFIPKAQPENHRENTAVKKGGIFVIFLFFVTIVMAVSFERLLHLPPFLGMMTGLSLLMLYVYHLELKGNGQVEKMYIFSRVAQAEWDTLLFFFGIMFAVGGLGYLGYLELMSSSLYLGWGPSVTNVLVGLISAVIDNIPVMFAIVSMEPSMDHFQWLLVTLTAGVGGSLLSIGSAAGVGLMGVSKGSYTFMKHLKWSWAVMIGYIASVLVHFLING